jgi:hypothetical protein
MRSRSRKAAQEASVRAAIDRYRIIGTPPEPKFDVMTSVVALALDVPTVILALSTPQGLWVKSAFGPVRNAWLGPESPIREAVDAHQPAVIADLRENRRYQSFALDREAPRAYAGVPIVTLDRLPIGTLAVFDTRVRSFSGTLLAILEKMSDAVTLALETRRMLWAATIHSRNAVFAFRADLQSLLFADHFSSENLVRIDKAPGDTTFDDIFDEVAPDDRRALEDLRLKRRPSPFAFRARARGRTGIFSELACVAHVVPDDAEGPFIIVECEHPPSVAERPPLYVLSYSEKMGTVGDRFDTASASRPDALENVYSKIDLGRQLLREENDDRSDRQRFADGVKTILEADPGPHQLIAFAVAPGEAAEILADLKREAVLHDRDLIVALDEALLVLLCDTALPPAAAAAGFIARKRRSVRYVLQTLPSPLRDPRAIISDILFRLGSSR